MKSPHPSRRQFIRNSGMILIGFTLLSKCGASIEEPMPGFMLDELPGGLEDSPRINAWLEILENGRIRVLTGKIELGQGIRVAVQQVAADELNTRPELIDVQLAETGITPDEGYTAGSRSIESSAMSVRAAAASASKLLRELAAPKLGVQPDELELADATVRTRRGSQALSFAEVLEGRQFEQTVTPPIELKAKSERRWIGQPVFRESIASMVKGETWHIQDLRFPNMVHARVLRPPAYGARLQAVDESGLTREVEGLLKLIRDGNFLGVIAEQEYQAVQARNYLKAHTNWSVPEKLPADSNLKTYLKGLPAESQQVEQQGEGLGEGPGAFTASYSKPYIMHAAMGPSCAVARYDGEKLEVWSHSQGIYPLRRSMAAMTGLAEEDIHIKGVPGSGVYGHNGADDAAADAALLAMAYPDRHVRLQWMRDDEHGWEPYGSAMVMECGARLDGDGRISHWKCDLWSDTHSTRPGSDAGNLLAARYLAEPTPLRGNGYRGGAYRNAPPYYQIPNLQIDAHFFSGPLRVSSLRSLGAYANIFAIESFMDELAEKAGKAPLAFRLEHSEDPRAIAVMEKVAEMCSAETTGQSEGMGYAFSRYKNSTSYCAVATKVRADQGSGELKVLKMWAAIDSGEVINPDGLRNQTEGGLIQSASWTLREAVGMNGTHVNTLDWNSYPIFGYADVPEIEVAIIDRPDEPPMGAGEAAQGPAAAAIANAVYAASGVRVRDLPIERNFLSGQ